MTDHWTRVDSKGRCATTVRYPGRRRVSRRCMNKASFSVTHPALGETIEVCGIHVKTYEGGAMKWRIRPIYGAAEQ